MLMYLKKSTNRKTARTYLSIVHSYHDKEKKQSRTKTIRSIGYLDVLEKEYDDPIAHFTEVAKEMNDEYIQDNTPVNLTINLSEKINTSTVNRQNFGYAAISKIYHELEIDKFLINRQRHSKESYSANAIMKLLVFARMLFPSSKMNTFNNRKLLFEKTDFSLDDVYRCLSFFDKHKDALQFWMHERIKTQYQRNTYLVYYDVTNYYFEIDKQDEMRRKGVSKEHRPDPIIQMGLFTDADSIPITYRLFPGNAPDKTTLIPMLREIQHNYSLGKVIIVADKGLTTGDNIWYTLSAKNGYVLSYSIRGANKEFKDYILDEEGYITKGEGFKIKSRLYPRTIFVTTTTGKKMKKVVDEKQVVFYSEKHALKAKADRRAALEKAKDLINNPGKYNKATSCGAAKYVKNLSFDPKTGEIFEKTKQSLSFDQEKLRKEEELDGYYAIVTSEYKESDERIVDIYRGLWSIEDSFKVTKSDLETRPVYLSRQDHIEAHFLTCFVALTISRLLEKRLNGKHSITSILESLAKASCTHMQENYYVFDYCDEILSDLGKELDIDFSKKFLPLKEIKKILASAKKR